MAQLHYDAASANVVAAQDTPRSFNVSLTAWLPVKTKDLAELTGQLTLMLKTGTPLPNTLEALRDQVDDDRLYEALDAVHRDISGGASFGRALAEHPKIFDNFYVNAVEAGEEIGQLPEVFHRLELYLRRKMELRGSIVSAMIYPAIISVIALCAVTFVVTFVLPRFTRIFEKAGVVLPAPTRMLLALSQFVANYWYTIPVAIALIVALVVAILRNARSRRVLDGLVLHLPIAGHIALLIQSTQMLRTLGTLLGSGVPLVKGLEVTQKACGNSRFKEFVAGLTLRVMQGDRLTASFEESDLILPSIKAMVATAERTGSLPLVMNSVADHLDEDITRRLKGLSAVLEPMIIVVMGVVVGFIAISILMPLFKLSAVAGGG